MFSDVCRSSSWVCFFFQAEDGIRDLVRSRGLGDVYKRQRPGSGFFYEPTIVAGARQSDEIVRHEVFGPVVSVCLLYTSDAADERSSVDLGGRRIIKKKTKQKPCRCQRSQQK